MPNELENYRKEAHKKVNEIFTEIEALEQKGRYAEMRQKDKINQKIEELKKRQQKLKDRYEDLKDKSGKSVDELKNGFEKARQDLQASWEKVKAEFS
jgi:cytochrome c556